MPANALGRALAASLLALGAAACGGGSTGAPAHGVRFVEPSAGAHVKSPVHFAFGVDGVTISPVPQGTVEHAREGMGHHHLGVDVPCLPEGSVIPKGTPSWVHFGKGDTTIDLQLEPGPHTFALQVGNDLHQTLAGYCQTLNIVVEP